MNFHPLAYWHTLEVLLWIYDLITLIRVNHLTVKLIVLALIILINYIYFDLIR